MNVADLIERVREILGEVPQSSTAKRLWTDQELLRHLNSGYETLWKKAKQADEEWGLDFFTLTALGAVQADIGGLMIGVSLPADIDTIAYVEEGFDASTEGTEIVKCGLRSTKPYQPTRFPSYEGRRGWMPAGEGNGLFFTKTNDPLNLDKTRIWFMRRAPRLVRFTASHPTTSSLRVSVTAGATLGQVSTVKDYYRNTPVECTLAGTPGASPQRLRFQVSAWAIQTHPNFDMTLSVAHGMAPGSSTWEVLPIFAEEHHELIAWLGAQRALARGGDSKQRDVILLEQQALYADFIQAIENRQIQAPREVSWEG